MESAFQADRTRSASYTYSLDMTEALMVDDESHQSFVTYGVTLTGADGEVLFSYPDVSFDGPRLAQFLRRIRESDVPDYQVADLIMDFVSE